MACVQHEFRGDYLSVPEGTYAWVYHDLTIDHVRLGTFERKPEIIRNGGKLFPTFPKENPRLIHVNEARIQEREQAVREQLTEAELDALSDEDMVDIILSEIQVNDGCTVLRWANIVSYQRKRGSLITASEETKRQRIEEYRMKHSWHLKENTFPAELGYLFVGIGGEAAVAANEYHQFLRGGAVDEFNMAKAMIPGFERASAADCVRATKYARCGCNTEGMPLILRTDGVPVEEEEEAEDAVRAELLRLDRIGTPNDAAFISLFNLINSEQVYLGGVGANDQLALRVAKNMARKIINIYNRFPNVGTPENKSARLMELNQYNIIDVNDGQTTLDRNARLLLNRFDRQLQAQAADNETKNEREIAAEPLDALESMMGSLNMVDETSDEEEFEAPAAAVFESSDEETFDEPAGHLSEAESESSIPSMAYATTSDDEFSAPAGHLSEAESESSIPSMAYATTSDDEFSAPAGELSEAESDIPSAAYTASSDSAVGNHMYASTSDTDDDFSTADLGWKTSTSSTQPPSSMYVSSSDQGDDLLSLTKDM